MPLSERLRADLAQPGDSVAMSLQIEQTVRNAARLEVLDRLLSGDVDAWLKLSLPRSDAKRGRILIEVKVDALAVEERNRSNLLRQQLAGIAAQRPTGGPTPRPPEDDDLNLD